TDNSSNELGFQIERDSGSGFTQIATTSANATNYTDASLPTGLYFYRVRAYNDGGTSGYSNTVSTTTGPALDHVVDYWKLDGDSSDSVGGNNGSDSAITYSTANGVINEGAGFDGSSSQINVGNMISGQVNFSGAAWIKTSSNADQRIIEQR